MKTFTEAVRYWMFNDEHWIDIRAWSWKRWAKHIGYILLVIACFLYGPDDWNY